MSSIQARYDVIYQILYLTEGIVSMYISQQVLQQSRNI